MYNMIIWKYFKKRFLSLLWVSWSHDPKRVFSQSDFAMTQPSYTKGGQGMFFFFLVAGAVLSFALLETKGRSSDILTPSRRNPWPQFIKKNRRTASRAWCCKTEPFRFYWKAGDAARSPSIKGDVSASGLGLCCHGSPRTGSKHISSVRRGEGEKKV